MYVYDALNCLTQMSQGDITADYGYDTNGNRAYVEYDNDLCEEYDYNLANLLTCLVNKNSIDTVLSQYDYTYTLDGNQASKTDQDGVVTDYTYDGLGRLTSESVTKDSVVSQSYTYTYDDFNNRATLTATGDEAYTTVYDYDLNNRLVTNVKTSAASVDTSGYFYDPNGNQIAKTSESLSDSSGSESVSLTEGVAGCELSSYNGYNQLMETDIDGVTAEYTYDPSGLRASKYVY